jgi:hypothetical protein
LRGGGGWRLVIRSRICRRFWPLWDLGAVCVNSLNAPMVGPRITPGDQGMANRPCLSSDARVSGKLSAQSASEQPFRPGYDFSVNSHII